MDANTARDLLPRGFKICLARSLYSATLLVRVTPRVAVAVDVRQPAVSFLTAATATAVKSAVNATTPLVAALIACRVSRNRRACLLTLAPGLDNERGDCPQVRTREPVRTELVVQLRFLLSTNTRTTYERYYCSGAGISTRYHVVLLNS
jgi:hypothetical protein